MSGYLGAVAPFRVTQDSPLYAGPSAHTAILQSNGTATVEELAKTTNLKESTINTTLRRLTQMFQKQSFGRGVPARWSLLTMNNEQ